MSAETRDGIFIVFQMPASSTICLDVTPAHGAVLVKEYQVGGFRGLEPQPLLPRVCAAVYRDHILVILLGRALSHPAIDEPFSQSRHSADHRDFVEGDLRFVAEVFAETTDPGLDGESRIVGEAQRQ
jgi:hypothetical protein